MRKIFIIFLLMLPILSCGRSNAAASGAAGESAAQSDSLQAATPFDADSAYSYVARQVAFGPRVPNTEAHRLCGDWLASELRRHGAEVTEQRADLRAFDGTVLHARNIFGRVNPEATNRVLLFAHWDCRPWADEDPDPEKRRLPVDGANDGASGVGVILEIARQLKETGSGLGVDLLLTDAEDWGSEGDEDSWALGTRYFVENPPVEGYLPEAAILLDMVGGHGATFCREYISQQADPALCQRVWSAAAELGYGDVFRNRIGGAVTDDHLRLIAAGIPAIDIIEFNSEGGGFNSRWHTTSDNMEGISRETLEAVGKTVMRTINHR